MKAMSAKYVTKEKILSDLAEITKCEFMHTALWCVSEREQVCSSVNMKKNYVDVKIKNKMFVSLFYEL